MANNLKNFGNKIKDNINENIVKPVSKSKLSGSSSKKKKKECERE